MSFSGLLGLYVVLWAIGFLCRYLGYWGSMSLSGLSSLYVVLWTIGSLCRYLGYWVSMSFSGLLGLCVVLWAIESLCFSLGYSVCMSFYGLLVSMSFSGLLGLYGVLWAIWVSMSFSELFSLCVVRFSCFVLFYVILSICVIMRAIESVCYCVSVLFCGLLSLCASLCTPCCTVESVSRGLVLAKFDTPHH